MSKLWTFGDSFTAGNGVLPNEPFPEYKKPEEGIPWPLILSQKLNLELKNKGMGLFSNDKIIDTILENYHFIREGDIVIIGKTFSFRVDIPNKKNDALLTVAPGHFYSLQNDYTKSEIQSINEFIILFDSPLVKHRQDFRFNFLKQLIEPKAKCILWDVDIWEDYETIKEATNYFIDDSHWSYKGHRDFADFMLNKITNNNTTLAEIKNKLI